MTRAFHPAPTGHHCDVPSSSRRTLSLSGRDERRWAGPRDPEGGDPVFECPDCGQWWGHGPGGQGHHGRFWQPMRAYFTGHQPDEWPQVRARERTLEEQRRSSPEFISSDRARHLETLRTEREAFETRVAAERSRFEERERQLQAELDHARDEVDTDPDER